MRVTLRVYEYTSAFLCFYYLSRVAPQENCSGSIPARVELGALPFPLSLPVVFAAIAC